MFQELTRNEAHLYVHACTAVPPHFLPLVAARLQLPPPVRLLTFCLSRRETPQLRRTWPCTPAPRCRSTSCPSAPRAYSCRRRCGFSQPREALSCLKTRKVRRTSTCTLHRGAAALPAELQLHVCTTVPPLSATHCCLPALGTGDVQVPRKNWASKFRRCCAHEPLFKKSQRMRRTTRTSAAAARATRRRRACSSSGRGGRRCWYFDRVQFCPYDVVCNCGLPTLGSLKPVILQPGHYLHGVDFHEQADQPQSQPVGGRLAAAAGARGAPSAAGGATLPSRSRLRLQGMTWSTAVERGAPRGRCVCMVSTNGTHSVRVCCVVFVCAVGRLDPRPKLRFGLCIAEATIVKCRASREQVDRPTVALPAPLADALAAIGHVFATEGGGAAARAPLRLPPHGRAPQQAPQVLDFSLGRALESHALAQLPAVLLLL